MDESAIFVTLGDIFHDVMGRDIELTPELTADDVDGWDSSRQIEIVVAAEQRFGIKITTREADALQNVGDLAALIARKTA